MKKNKKIIWYQDVINLGFTRQDGNDSVWYEQLGYQYFIVSKQYDNVLFDWDAETRKVTISLLAEDGYTILIKKKVKSLKCLQELIEVYDKLEEKKKNINKDYLEIFNNI